MNNCNFKNIVINKNIFILFCLTLFSNLILSQCSDDGNYWNESWISCQTSQSPNSIRGNGHWILYEFHQAENIDSSHIWNANRTGESMLGAKDIVVDYSIDGNSWLELGTYTFPKATELIDYNGFEGPNFGGVFIKKILITVLTNHNIANNNCVSLAEVQFKINQNACYGIIDDCGICNGTGEKEWFIDADTDGLGSGNSSTFACDQPIGYVANQDDNCDNGFLGWNDISMIFDESNCTGCHGNNGESGLNLRSYNGIISGGIICGNNILTGTTLVDLITTTGYDECGITISGQAMNDRVSNPINSAELVLIQNWINDGALNDCNCLPNSMDSDNDGICDASDKCNGIDDNIAGTSCNDGLVCTENDVYDDYCNCIGTAKNDSDLDGICDELDAEPFNACTADGILDGNEPEGWIALSQNDCDLDGVHNYSFDLNDFDECVSQFGFTKNTSCICPNDKKTAGGTYVSSIGVANETAADGLPNGIVSGSIAFIDEMVLSYPFLNGGELICFTLGFNNPLGKIGVDINGYSFSISNATEDTIFTLQEHCIEVLNSGIQLVKLTDIGNGSARIDGSTYFYCECSPADPNYNSPKCKCINNNFGAGTFDYDIGVGSGENADGLPDGILTGAISLNDSLVLSYPNLNAGSEICVTLGLSSIYSNIIFNLGNEDFTFYNQLGEINYALQEFCVPVNVSGIQTLIIYENGGGNLKVDGSKYIQCDECISNNDSDNDAVCDEFDVCNGYDDNLDDDFDGIPNDCESCALPSSIFTANNTDSTITIIWNEINEALNYKLSYREIGALYWNEIVVNNDNFHLENLECKSYEFTLLSNCGFGFTSNESTINNFESTCYLECPISLLETTNAILQSGVVQVSEFIESNGMVINGRTITYKAGNYIELKNNFEVSQNADFEAIIEDCPSSN